MRLPWAHLAFLALAAAALHPAAAQVPPLPLPPPPATPFAAAVSITAPAALELTSDQPASVQVTVKNEASRTGSDPLDAKRRVSVEVRGAPEGWTAAVEQPGDLELGPGESANLTLQVTVTGKAKPEAVLTLTAHLYPLGAAPIPILGPEADPERTDSATVTATRRDDPARAFVETVGPVAVAGMLGLVLLLVVVLAVVAARRRGPLRLEAASPDLAVPPGGRLVVPLVVRNAGRRAERAVLQTTAPTGWRSQVPDAVVDLDPGQETSVELVVAASRQAVGPVQVLVLALTERAAGAPARLAFTARVGPRQEGPSG